jgi:hypothetical protein
VSSSTSDSTPPYWRSEHRAARARVDEAALAETAHILRQVAAYDAHLDARRGDVSFGLAALVEACGRSYRELPDDVARQALFVAAAVDRATGHRRSG